MQELGEGSRWMVRLDTGESVFETLSAFAHRHEIRAGVLVEGIGLLASATLGYWDGRQYQPRELTTPHELVSLHGSIAEEDGTPSVHLHAALSGPDHQVVGGHLVRGTVGVLLEAYIESFPGRSFARPLDESLGLRRIDLLPGPNLR